MTCSGKPEEARIYEPTTSGGVIVGGNFPFSWAIASDPPTKNRNGTGFGMDVEGIEHGIDTGLNAGPQTEMV